MTARVTRLPSGITVVSDAMPHLETAALSVWVGAGGRNEQLDEHGISHLLEHMAFKGTTRRTARQIVEEIETVGGELNAATSAENTSYYARVLKADVPLALDVLADILSDPSFDPEEIEREKSVIIQEIGAVLDTPDDAVFEHLHELAFPDQPIGRSLLGTAKTLKRFDRAVLRDYLARHYRAPGIIVAAAGAVDHEAVAAETATRFAAFKGPESPSGPPAKFGGGTRIIRRDLEQAHMALALEGVAQKDASLFSLQAFSAILGGGMSSRLFQEVREKRGLCYSIYAFHTPYSDTGMFGLYAGADAADAPQLMQVVVDEMKAAIAAISENEVARAKAQMKAGLLMAMESCSARAEQIARHIAIYGRPLSTAELLERIDAVTVGTTRAAGEALLARGRSALAVLGTGRRLDQVVTIAENALRAG
jgi:predicted Zn-dependent peptidase